MKKCWLFLLVFFNVSFGICQLQNDTIDFDNINYKLLDSLLFEEAMKYRALAGANRMKKDVVCDRAAKYQSEYLTSFNLCSHSNNKAYKGVLLTSPGKRFAYFLKEYPTNRLLYDTKIEVLIMLEALHKINYWGLKSKTYLDYAIYIMKSFMTSKSHKFGIEYDMKDFGDIHGSFMSHYNKKHDCLCVTGLFVLVIKT